jgi:hypothetical protein
MSDGRIFTMDRLDAAVSKLATFDTITGPPRRQTVRQAMIDLRDHVANHGVAAPSLELDAIAHSLIRTESGRTLARAVGARELDGFEKYENEDPGWIKCLLEYASSYPVDFPIAGPGTAIYSLQGGEEIKIALAGDWGTNNPPAVAIAGYIKAANPDYTIHLGDVYYTGDPKDELTNLGELWPSGRYGSFALNSNHEMYCGGTGYFQVIRKQKFMNQGFSYFALYNDNWLIIGLDTAYWGHNQSFLYEDGYISDDRIKPKGNAQKEWLVDLLGRPEHQHKRLIILTHHDGFDLDVGKVNKKNLWGVITQLLGNTRDCLWYWGHVHAGIAYKPIQLAEKVFLRARCVGHGGVPYAPFGELSSYGNATYAIEWAEQEKATTGDPRRALNGYMILTLKGKGITEEFYDECGRRRPWTGYS